VQEKGKGLGGGTKPDLQSALETLHKLNSLLLYPCNAPAFYPKMIGSDFLNPLWLTILTTLFVAYMFIVAKLRNRRALASQKRFNMLTRDDFAKMTTDNAHEILKDLTELEFPKFMGFSIVFALFKVLF